MTRVEQAASTLPPPVVPQKKQCRCCGSVFTHAEWLLLPFVGLMADGLGGYLELRQCGGRDCNTTLSVQATELGEHRRDEATEDADEARGERFAKWRDS